MPVLSRYDVRREIGRDGMGVVYEAHVERLDRTVSLKAPEIRIRDHRTSKSADADEPAGVRLSLTSTSTR